MFRNRRIIRAYHQINAQRQMTLKSQSTLTLSLGTASGVTHRTALEVVASATLMDVSKPVHPTAIKTSPQTDAYSEVNHPDLSLNVPSLECSHECLKCYYQPGYCIACRGDRIKGTMDPVLGTFPCVCQNGLYDDGVSTNCASNFFRGAM